MKGLTIIGLLIVLLLSDFQASGQYFVSIAKRAEEFVGFPCFIKLKTGEEIYGESGAIIWGKYRIKSTKGYKIILKAKEISLIAYDVSKSKTYVWGLINESRDAMSRDRKMAVKDTFIFENIDGYGLVQWINPGLTDKMKIYACDISEGNTSNEEDEENGEKKKEKGKSFTSMKYLILRSDAKQVLIDKSNYRKALKEVFSDCPKMLSGFYDEQMRWDDIGRHIHMYLELCK